MHVIAAGARRRLANEHNARAWLAWNVAALNRERRLPRLGSLMIEADKPKPVAQTWREQLKVAEMLAGKRKRRVARAS